MLYGFLIMHELQLKQQSTLNDFTIPSVNFSNHQSTFAHYGTTSYHGNNHVLRGHSYGCGLSFPYNFTNKSLSLNLSWMFCYICSKSGHADITLTRHFSLQLLHKHILLQLHHHLLYYSPCFHNTAANHRVIYDLNHLNLQNTP